VIITTTSTLEGRPVRDYLGLVGGEVIVGANVIKDVFASVSDFFGGRSGAYESSIQKPGLRRWRRWRPLPAGSAPMRSWRWTSIMR
jgi:hypothetical protein